jgi:hypothetical protein
MILTSYANLRCIRDFHALGHDHAPLDIPRIVDDNPPLGFQAMVLLCWKAGPALNNRWDIPWRQRLWPRLEAALGITQTRLTCLWICHRCASRHLYVVSAWTSVTLLPIPFFVVVGLWCLPRPASRIAHRQSQAPWSILAGVSLATEKGNVRTSDHSGRLEA